MDLCELCGCSDARRELQGSSKASGASLLTSHGDQTQRSAKPEETERVTLATRPLPKLSVALPARGRRPSPCQGATLPTLTNRVTTENANARFSICQCHTYVFTGAPGPLRRSQLSDARPQVAPQTAAANHDDSALTFTFPIIRLLCLRGIFSSLNSPSSLVIGIFLSPIHI